MKKKSEKIQLGIIYLGGAYFIIWAIIGLILKMV